MSLSCISRLIFVAHGTGKFPSEEETRDARQIFRLAKPAARVAAAGPTQCSPQDALVRVPRLTGNWRRERAGLETELDLDSGSAQGIAGTER